MAMIDDLRTSRDQMADELKTLTANPNRGPTTADGIAWDVYRERLVKMILDLEERIRKLELLAGPTEVRSMGVA